MPSKEAGNDIAPFAAETAPAAAEAAPARAGSQSGTVETIPVGAEATPVAAETIPVGAEATPVAAETDSVEAEAAPARAGLLFGALARVAIRARQRLFSKKEAATADEASPDEAVEDASEEDAGLRPEDKGTLEGDASAGDVVEDAGEGDADLEPEGMPEPAVASRGTGSRLFARAGLLFGALARIATGARQRLFSKETASKGDAGPDEAVGDVAEEDAGLRPEEKGAPEGVASPGIAAEDAGAGDADLEPEGMPEPAEASRGIGSRLSARAGLLFGALARIAAGARQRLFAKKTAPKGAASPDEAVADVAEEDAGLRPEEKGAPEGAASPGVAAEDAGEGDADLEPEEPGVAEGDASPDKAGEEEVPASAAIVATAAGDGSEGDAGLGEEKKVRRRLLLTLLLLLLLAVCVGAIFGRYLLHPAPLPELLPLPAGVNYAPHYLFSVYGVEKPVGVALSPQGDRIYVTESGGERLVKIFDREGRPLGSFAPPRTSPVERSPVYLAVDGSGRVLVTDRLQHAVFVYDREGNCLDAVLGPDLTLSEYVAEQMAGLQPGATFAYNLFDSAVYYQHAGEGEQILPAPGRTGWAPLGIRVDRAGNIFLTDVLADRHVVREIPAKLLAAASGRDFDPPEIVFGAYGQNNDEFLFPNAAVVDSLDRIYVTDGNNGRISVWDRSGDFLFVFGQGANDGALSLPRGATMDARDRLHVVDAVEQNVKVYDVSGLEPRYLFAFGEWGMGDGQFNYPNDIALDATGRLYVADRENNRIQIWSY